MRKDSECGVRNRFVLQPIENPPCCLSLYLYCFRRNKIIIYIYIYIYKMFIR